MNDLKSNFKSLKLSKKFINKIADDNSKYKHSVQFQTKERTYVLFTDYVLEMKK